MLTRERPPDSWTSPAACIDMPRFATLGRVEPSCNQSLTGMVSAHIQLACIPIYFESNLMAMEAWCFWLMSFEIRRPTDSDPWHDILFRRDEALTQQREQVVLPPTRRGPNDHRNCPISGRSSRLNRLLSGFCSLVERPSVGWYRRCDTEKASRFVTDMPGRLFPPSPRVPGVSALFASAYAAWR